MTEPHLAPGGVTLEHGRLRLHGLAAALCRWFDREFLAMALTAGATECRFPVTLPRATLARAGYFDAFPDGASALAPGAVAGDYCLCPAVCYHAYAWLEGGRLDAPVTLTAAQTCFREADRTNASNSRLWEFSMREVIFLGPPAWVAAQRHDWEQRIQAVSSRLGLDGTLEPATDPFFGEAARGQRLLQQIKGLKTELRMTIGPERAAVASFNRHDAFFSRRFGFGLAGGAVAHSGCVAFGLERWALAYLAQRGAAAASLVAE